MPPASKKFFANSVRAVKSESLPRLARKTFGRAPVAASMRSEASRSCLERLGEADAGQGGEAASFARACRGRGAHIQHMHRRLVNIRETRSCRSARRGAARCSSRVRRASPRPCCWIKPCSSAASAPPAFSISWNSVHAAAQSCCGQILDAAGARRRIGDLREVRLLQQHELRVARDAAREARRAGRAPR